MGEPEYDAFISYSRALDGKLAPALQRGVQRFAKPRYKPRGSRVFLDDASLSATPGLWTALEGAMRRSKWMILMASPEAAASEWVNRELAWWLENKSAQRILVVLTSGEYAQSVPPAVRKALGEEPRWVDLRWLRDVGQVDDSNPRLHECVADVASAVRGVPKDDLVGEHIRQHRWTVRLTWGAIATLVMLVVSVLVAANIAAGQRDAAVAQARTATARGLASAAVANLRTDLGLSQALAAEAYRVEANGQTRAALFEALTASPHLDRYLPIGGEVTALATSADGRVAIAGTADGRVVRWDVAARLRTERKVGPRPVTAVATSTDGKVVAAFAAGYTLRWDVSSATTQVIDTPDDLTRGLVAVSPWGRFTAVYSTSASGEVDGNGFARAKRIVHDGHRGRIAERDDPSVPVFMLRLPDDHTLLEVSYNDWVRREPTTLETTSVARGTAAPANGFWVGLSADGDFFGFSKEGETRLWRTSQQAFDFDTQDVRLAAGRDNPSAGAISNDGARAAVADAGAIYIYDMTGPVTGERTRLEGNGQTPFVEFFGIDNNRLISAARDRLVLWDLTRTSRIGSTPVIRVPLSCTACPAPRIAAAHDQIAVVSGADVAVEWYRNTAGPDSKFGPVVWDATGDTLYLVTMPGGVGEIWKARYGLSRIARWDGHVVAEYVVAIGVSPDNRRLLTVNERGDVQVFEGDRLASARIVEVGRKLDQQGWPPAGHLAAVSTDATTAALVLPDSVTLVDAMTGQLRDLPGGAADAVAFTTDSLLVQRAGVIEVWETNGGSLRRTVPSDPSYLPGLAVSPGTALAAQLRTDHVLVITNLKTGELVGQLRLTEQRGRFGRIGMAFADDQSVITAISDKPLHRWDLSEENWVRAACASAGRDLSADEWRRYVGTEPPSDLTCG
ncbi:TIR domain-containing protein [Lentzea alba]|uniref:TIR domain-containing protein n=1 Tax=Lentzea alba TaxID=2714351 RepID=UPI0039BED304